MIHKRIKEDEKKEGALKRIGKRETIVNHWMLDDENNKRVIMRALMLNSIVFATQQWTLFYCWNPTPVKTRVTKNVSSAFILNFFCWVCVFGNLRTLSLLIVLHDFFFSWLENHNRFFFSRYSTYSSAAAKDFSPSVSFCLRATREKINSVVNKTKKSPDQIIGWPLSIPPPNKEARKQKHRQGGQKM